MRQGPRIELILCSTPRPGLEPADDADTIGGLGDI
jgi:hypothetical protein